MLTLLQDLDDVGHALPTVLCQCDEYLVGLGCRR